MKLEKKIATEIAEKCAVKLISSLGEEKIAQVPYDVVLSELAEMVEDIEDKIDTIVNSKMEETMTQAHEIEDLWGDD